MSWIKLSLSASSAAGTIHSTSCRTISTSAQLNINTSPCLQAQPMKKKHRVDPAVERNRLERKKRKLLKRIRQLERHTRLFKPVEELMPNFELKEELSFRERHRPQLSVEEQERRQLLLKAWSKEMTLKTRADTCQLSMVVAAQEEALQELKKVSPNLYSAAVSREKALLPYTGKGPSITPPIPSYETPDGNYIDKSKKWIITATGELI